MISDKNTNTIYFSELLKTDNRFASTFEEINNILKRFGGKPKLLPKTNDIWARDYMPIQISSDKFVEYRYDPDYLQGANKGHRDLKTYPDIVCNSLKLNTTKSDLILDGGNLIKSSDCIILTDKIVKENRLTYSKNELIKKLHDTFLVDKVVLIPWDTNEKYGHSDGMMRFITNNTVLINGIYENDTVLTSRLKKYGLKCEYLRFKVRKRDKRNWAYINFLQTKDLILIPKLEIEEDELAFKQITDYYPDYGRNQRIESVDMTEVVKHGGALNCITWTIKT